MLDQGNLFQTSVHYNPDRTMAYFVETNTQDTQDANASHIHHTYDTLFFAHSY